MLQLLTQIMKQEGYRYWCATMLHKWTGDVQYLKPKIDAVAGTTKAAELNLKFLNYMVEDNRFHTMYCEKCGYVYHTDQQVERKKYIDIEERHKMLDKILK